ncbi:unnamed protein product [Debaryomyces tyrocola]|nr:unnamed protein product [Debaryomyces tyrocola]
MPRLPSSSDPFQGQNELPQSSNFMSRANSIIQDKLVLMRDVGQQTLDWYQSQPLWKRTLLQVLFVLNTIVVVLIMIFHKSIIQAIVVMSDKWHELKFGQVLLFTLIFMVGFPPLLGFSALSTLTGMVYGFVHGWILLACASISGSFCSFLVFRYLLHSRAERLMNSNKSFRAFSEILREDSSLFILVLLRLCPLPYSLSNGALAAIPELPATTYFLASLITSPKLMIHIFVGHKLKDLGDDTKGKSTHLIDILSIIITGAAASLTTYIIYNKMQRKLEFYHQRGIIPRDDAIIFGNFEDIESANNVELNSADYDADNFIIEDEDEGDDETATDPDYVANKKNILVHSEDQNGEFEVDENDGVDDLGLGEISKNSKQNTNGYRDY